MASLGPSDELRVPRRVPVPPGWAPPTHWSTEPDPDPQHRKVYTTSAQYAAVGTAALFGLVGLLGFLPGFTTDIGELHFAGHHSAAVLFGLFTVSVLHNVVHLLFALTGLAMAIAPEAARRFLIWGGVIYLVLALFGTIIDRAGAINFIPVNTADNWLHLGLGLGMIGLGVLSRS